MTAQLRLDLDIMERNARRMASEIATYGKLWRPHVKSHCQPQIASALIDMGACGVTAANVYEVEVMAQAGIPSVLLAHLVVSEHDLDRLAAASRQTNLLVTIDHFVHAELYSKTAERHATEFNVLVDVDVGMQRTGCRPRIDATHLAAAASQLPGIQIAGIMGYEGHLVAIPDAGEKHSAIFEAMNCLQQTRDSFQQQGICCEIVSAGGSGTFSITAQHECVTELQAGGGIFGDLFYQRQCGLSDVTSAITVEAEVVSRPSLTQAVINCGRKAINPYVADPEVIGISGASVAKMSAEHTTLTLVGPARDLKIGDTVNLVVGYSDHSLLMHREIHVYRGEEKLAVWPVVRGS